MRFIEIIKCELVVAFIEVIDGSMNHNSSTWPSMKAVEPAVFLQAVVMLWQPCQPSPVLLVIIGLAHRALAHRALSKSCEHRKIVSSGVYVEIMFHASNQTRTNQFFAQWTTERIQQLSALNDWAHSDHYFGRLQYIWLVRYLFIRTMGIDARVSRCTYSTALH